MREAQYTKQELQAAHTILTYLSKHPSSSDTLQGIATWWLKKERFDYTKKQIRQALAYLVGKGLVSVKKYNQQEEYYRAGPDFMKWPPGSAVELVVDFVADQYGAEMVKRNQLVKILNINGQSSITPISN